MRRGHHGDPGNASPRPRGRVSASMPSGWRRLVRECLKRTVLWPIVLILRAYERHLARRDPRKLQALRYRRTMGIALHIDNPVSLDDT